MNEEQNQNRGDDISQDVTKQAGKAGKEVAGKVGNAVKKKVIDAGKKALQEVGKVAVKAIIKSLIVLAPYLAVILIVLSVIVSGYYILFETRGTQQEYTFKQATQNQDNMIQDNKNNLTYMQTKGAQDGTGQLSSENGQIKEFYGHFSQISYWQIPIDDTTNQKLKNYDGGDFHDYYWKEQAFNLNSNFLFSLDEYMYQNKFRYPEQFVKPVNYDPQKLTLKPLTDEHYLVNVLSKEYGDDGKETGNKIKSVADYGIASVFKYKKDVQLHFVEGDYYQRDVWDKENGLHQEAYTEHYKDNLEGYPKDIFLMTTAVTFQGTHNYTYENKTQQIDTLKAGKSPNKHTDFIKILYGYAYPCDKCEPIPLYKYRKGAVYETIPVQKEDKFEDAGQRYLKDYLYNFQSFMPKSVMTDFNFDKRVGQINNFDMNLGGSIKSDSFAAAAKYKDDAIKYGAMYGIDPYIIIAMIAQESSGKADVAGGLMQLSGHPDGEVLSATLADGQTKSSITIQNSQINNADYAVHVGVAELKSNLDRYHDLLKAITAYNMGNIDGIKNRHPEAWNSIQWMNYREEQRLHNGESEGHGITHSASYNCNKSIANTTGIMYGDSCYLEDVLRYYAGNDPNLKALANHSGKAPATDGGFLSSIGNYASSFMNSVVSTVSSWFHTYKNDEPHIKYDHPAGGMEYEWILKMATAMNHATLFSKTDDISNLDLWQPVAGQSLSNPTLDGQQLLDLIADAKGFQPPLNDPHPVVTSPYGNRDNPNAHGSTEHHPGIDLGCNDGTKVYATGDGVVTKTVSDNSYGGYGNVVIIKHSASLQSVYGHVMTIYVKEGEHVQRGQLIALSGHAGNSTGPHLHFELDKLDNGNAIPIDPTSVAINPAAFKNANYQK
ncbi:M23 family metallopeptidase (plasmid) [Aneurinibacillus sp. Ricciae_BoGa-3]|uniref:M23 family metallopeptidase n=1 Tax=Aneurinibacillus sp. Ricciae_BoGa-3 TaxID=3022697 RepID=UPI0023417A65|nr:M23 family metallopeptidase [Aneurinibacillus sp. Ricciae_BoGa-3]WCK56946.1 M23 family metallopeptidase [Aneurinibacillus sp. Ricciae_BoGa-3]